MQLIGGDHQLSGSAFGKGKRDSDQTWLQLFGSGQVFSYVPKIIRNVKNIYIETYFEMIV